METSVIPKTRLQAVVSWLVFPVLMAGSLATVYYFLLLDANEGVAVFSVIAVAAIVIMVLERVTPYRKEWNKGDGDIKTDLINMLVAQTLIPRLTTPLWGALLASSSAYLANQFGGDIWPHHWPIVFQLFLMLAIAEFGRYWVHRWAHRNAILWRFHSVHHSPNRLYWMNAGRFHPIEKVYLLIPEVIPFILMGTNIETLSLYFVFNGIHGLLQHSNIRIKLGWLNYLFSMSELHRWHHSKRVGESDNNFGNNLIIWDILFRTFYLPKGREVGDIGLLNPEYPKTYMGQCMAPFNKERLHYPKAMRDRIKQKEAKKTKESVERNAEESSS